MVTTSDGEQKRERVTVDEVPAPLRLCTLALVVNETAYRPPRPPPTSLEGWGLSAGPSARGYVDSGSLLVGGQLELSMPVRPWLTADLGLSLEADSSEARLGTVVQGFLALRAAPMWVLAYSGPPSLRLGPEVEVGVAYARPRASMEVVVERELSGALWSVSLRSVAEARAHGAWSFRLDVFAGIPWGGIRPRAEGQPVGGMAGPYFRASLSIGHR